MREGEKVEEVARSCEAALQSDLAQFSSLLSQHRPDPGKRVLKLSRVEVRIKLCQDWSCYPFVSRYGPPLSPSSTIRAPTHATITLHAASLCFCSSTSDDKKLVDTRLISFPPSISFAIRVSDSSSKFNLGGDEGRSRRSNKEVIVQIHLSKGKAKGGASFSPSFLFQSNNKGKRTSCTCPSSSFPNEASLVETSNIEGGTISPSSPFCVSKRPPPIPIPAFPPPIPARPFFTCDLEPPKMR